MKKHLFTGRRLGLGAKLAVVAAGAMTLANNVSAQQILEEILVTATKRSESLQDVGVSVAAFSGEALERMGLKNSDEILLQVPNLEIISNAGATNANIFLRGIGSAGIGFNIQGGVGLYSDEVALNSPVVNILQTYDLERVEVLRGPQNTLYGRNTTGGAVNFISRKPEIGGEANGYLNAAYGRFSQFDLEGAYGAPLGENAAIRISGQGQFRGGIRENLETGRKDQGREKYAGRAQLAFDPSEQVSMNFKAHLERVRSDNIRFKNVGAYAPDSSGGNRAPCATPFALGACSNGFGFVGSATPREINSDMEDPQNNVNAGGASAQIAAEFENFRLTSITAYEENSQELSEDSDAYSGHSFHFWIESEQRQFSQEIRLTSKDDSDFRWIVGGYGFWEDKTGTTGPTWGTPMGTMLVRSTASFDNTTYSAYVDGEYDLSERATLKGGFRYGSDNIQGNSIALFAFESALGGLDITTPSKTGEMLPDFEDLLAAGEASGALVLRVGGPSDPDSPINDKTFNEWGAKAGVDIRPAQDVLVYGQWSRGFKAGSFPNAPMAIMLGFGDVPIRPEIVNAYEVGLKAEFAEGRARLNAAAFFNDYQDQQNNEFVDGEFRVVNTDSEILGAELDLSLLPAEGVYIDLGLGLLDTEITASRQDDWEGNQLLNAPQFTARVAFRKEWNLASDALFGIGADGRYASKRHFSLNNLASDGGYFITNAQAWYEFGADGQYRVSLWGRNLFNALYYNNRFLFDDDGGGTDYHTVYPSDPATFGISARVGF